MLFQFGALFTDMTVFENVAFPMREHTDMSDEMIRDLVLMKLEAVGLRGAHKLMHKGIFRCPDLIRGTFSDNLTAIQKVDVINDLQRLMNIMSHHDRGCT